MEQIVLADQNQFPTEEVVYAHIGKSKVYWQSFFDHIHTNYPEIDEQWKYYKDGKSWLMKVTRKAKTVFWLSLVEDTFRVTFYFTDKAEEAINNSSISDELKNNFITGKRYNKIRGITVTFRNKNDVEYAKSLITIKLNIK